MKIFRIIEYLFLPHSSNNHHPRALHSDLLFLYILILLLVNLSLRLVSRQMPDVLGYATDIRVEQLLSLTNLKRKEAGLSHLQLNSRLSEAAANKARDMFTQNYWAHNSPNGKKPWDFIISSGYNYTLAGENLAKNFSTSDNVVTAWMASPSHRDNILKKGYQDIGFAVVDGILNGEETTLVVQMFGTSASPKVQVSKPSPLGAKAFPSKGIVKGNQNASVFSAVTKKPLIDIVSFTREIVFVFIGIMIGILLIDAIVVTRRQIVRLSGHNLAHILFFTAMLINLIQIGHGMLL